MAPLHLWFKGLTPELIKKAKDELGETTEIKTKALAEFKQLVEEQKDLYSRMDDVFLLRFLRVKKFNSQKALEVLRNYYTYRTKNANLFTCLKPSDVKHVIEMNAMSYLPYRTPEGCHIALFRIGAFDPNVAKLEELFATVLMCGEMVFECEATQICGTVIIIDFRGMSFQHYRMFFNTSIMKSIISSYQESWPQRVKGLHFVHQPSTMTVMYRMIKPFLKKKILARLQFHGNNLSGLHEYVSRDLLPEDLEGHLLEYNNKEFTSYFFSQEEYIANINKYKKLKK